MTRLQRTRRCAAWTLLAGLVLLGPGAAATHAFQDYPPPWAGGPPRVLPGMPEAPFPPAAGYRAAPPADPPVPSVAIRVRVPGEVGQGEELTYQITAENVSRGDAHHVTVRVPAPRHARFVRATPEPAEKEPALIWRLGTLKGLQKKEIRLVVRPTGDGEVSCCARVQFEHGQCVRTRLVQPGLQLRASGPTQVVSLYEFVTFKVEVSNTGRATARNVLVEETLPPEREMIFQNSKPAVSGDNPLIWKVGDLRPGQKRVLEYTAIPKVVGKLTIKVEATAEGGIRRSAERTLQVGQPALKVVKSGPKKRLVGRPATYRITVSNPGTGPATHVALTDELPAEIAYVGASAGGRLDRDVVRWNLGTLKPGEARSFQVVVRAKKAGTFLNVCTAEAAHLLKEQGKAETTFEAPTGLALEMDASGDPVEVGKPFSLTVRALNLGKAQEKKVYVKVTVPEGLKALDVQGAPGSTIKDGVVTLPPLASLPAGRETSVVLRLQADKPGEHTLRAEAGSDSGVAVTLEETVTVRK